MYQAPATRLRVPIVAGACLLLLLGVWTCFWPSRTTGPGPQPAAPDHLLLAERGATPQPQEPAFLSSAPLLPPAPAPETPPASADASLLQDATLLDTRTESTPGGGRRTLKLYRKESFKYPLVRVVEVQEGGVMRREAMVGDHAMMRFPRTMSGADVEQWAAKHGWSVRKQLRSPGVFLIAAGAARADAIDQLMQGHALDFGTDQEAAVYAEPDYLQFAMGTPNDPSYSQLWGLHNNGQSAGTADADIDAPEGWDIATGSRSVVVGVIDTGVALTHSDLAANAWTNPGEVAANGVDDDGNGYVDDVRGWDFYQDDSTPDDGHSHGTHVAGTIGAVGDNSTGIAGVAWQVSLMALRFLNNSGSGVTSDAVEAVLYATDKGVLLTSNSWGGGGYSQALKDAIDAANTAGVLFVAAAGNNSTNNDSTVRYPSSYASTNIISVASTTRTDSLSYFSNWGATSVDLGAPGSDIFSTVLNNGYGIKSGTSMATPHVSGALAVMKALAPAATPVQLKQALLASVDSISALTGRCVSGGRLNLNRSLQAVRQYSTDVTEFAADESIGGNGDGLINPGEEVVLRFKVVNRSVTTNTNVTVTVTAGTGSAYSIANGTANLGDIGSGAEVACETLRLRVDPATITPRPETVAISLRFNTPAVEVVRSFSLPIFTSATISGLVTDADTGEPVPGIVIGLAGASEGEALSGEDGRYSVLVGDGTYKLQATGSNYTPTAAQTVTTPPSRAAVDFTMGRALLRVSTASIEERLAAGDEITRYISISNPGTAPLNWQVNLREATQGQETENIQALSTQSPGMVVGIPDRSTYGALRTTVNGLGGSCRTLTFPLTEDGLQGLDAIVLDEGFAYAKAADIALVRRHVQRGMGLVLTTTYSADALTNQFNALLVGAGITVAPGYCNELLSNIRPHPATANVESLYADYYCTVCTLSGTAAPLVLKTNGEVVCAASSLGRGRVLVVATGMWGYYSQSYSGPLFQRQGLQWVTAPQANWLMLPVAEGTVAPGATTIVPVRLSAIYELAGTLNANLTVTSNAITDSSATVPVSLTIRDAGGLVLSTSELGFPDIYVGATAGQQIHLFNGGTQNVVVRSLNLPSAAFSTKRKFPVTIAPRDSIAMTVEFAPREPKTYSGEISFLSDDKTNRLLRLPVTGTGLEAGVLQMTPSFVSVRMSYGETTVVPITVANVGGGPPLTYSAFHEWQSDSGSYYSLPSVTIAKPAEPIAPGATQTINLTIQGSNGYAASASGSVFIRPNLPGNPTLQVGLTVVIASAATLAITPGSLQFGEMTVGKSASKTVELRNTGNLNLIVSSIAVPSASWRTTTSLPKFLSPGSTTSLDIIFDPAKAGVLDGALTLTSNDTSQPQRSLAVRGSGLPAPTIEVTPGALEFDGANGEVTPPSQTLKIANEGLSPLVWNISPFDPNALSLDSALAKLDAGATELTAVIPQRYSFTDGVTGFYINDGGNDMYDGGNYLSTNLSTGFINYSDGVVRTGEWVGPTGRYFTRKHNGLFVFTADLDGATSFTISGNLGADGGGAQNSTILTTTANGATYKGFVKRTYGTSDPSVNHLIIVEDNGSLSHTIGTSTDDDLHTVRGLQGRTRLYYLLCAGSSGYQMSDAQMLTIMDKFLSTVQAGLTVSWLTCQPTSGKVAPGGVATVTATATLPPGLAIGAHIGSIFVTHNAARPPVAIPATLTHVAAPQFSVGSDSITAPATVIGKSSVGTLSLINSGTGPVTIGGLNISNAAFAFESISGGVTFPYILAAGQTRTLNLGFTPNQVGDHTGELIVTTSDPARPAVAVSLSGQGLTATNPSLLPESLTMDVYVRRTVSKTVAISNTGGGAFTWTAVARPVPGYTPPPGAPDTPAAVLSLEAVLAAVNNHAASLSGAIPERFDFTDGASGSSIVDGGNDMFDVGNLLWTNLAKTGPLVYSDDAVRADAGFGAGGRFFTRKLAGLFVLAADLDGVSEFRTAGGLGADGAGSVNGAILSTTVHGRTYTGFVKRVYGAGTDPSVNHLIIAEAKPGQAHDYAASTDDDAHRVSNLETTTRLYYLLYGAVNGALINDADTLNLMNTFLTTLGPTLGSALTAAPTSGSVAASPDSDLITVTANAAQLDVGTYRGAVDVTASFPPGYVRSSDIIVNVLSAPLISVTPAAYNFGTAYQNQVRTTSLTIRNTGDLPLTVTGATMPAPVFTTTSSFPFTVSAGGVATVVAIYQPVDVGIQSGNIVVASDDPTTPNLNIPITGTCQGSPVLSVESTSLNVTLAYGENATRSLQLANTGNATLAWWINDALLFLRNSSGDLTSQKVLPNIPTYSGSNSIAAGESEPMTVTIPGTLPPGLYSAEIRFGTNEPPGTAQRVVQVYLDIKSVPRIAASTMQPNAELAFGGVAAPSTKTLILTLRNTGTQNLTIGAVGLPGADFSTTGVFPATVLPNASLAVPVKFAPTVDRTWTTNLTVSSNDPTQPVLNIPVTAEGMLQGTLQSQPGALSFTLGVGQRQTQTLELSNTGGRAAAWSAIATVTGGTGGTSSANAELSDTLMALDGSAATLVSAIPGRYDFSGGISGNNISDGGGDMFDGGNYLTTNRSTTSGMNYSDGVVRTASDLGPLGRYFTRKFDGLFIFAADLDNVVSFTIGGDLGADGSGSQDTAILTTTVRGHSYKGFVKRVFGAGDPSVNHLIIVRDTAGLSHSIGPNTNSDYHSLTGLATTTRLYYLLYAGQGGARINDAAALDLMNRFLNAVPSNTPAWVSLDPAAGSVAAGDGADVAVTVDAANLNPGSHSAAITITSPDIPDIIVPVSLAVIDADLTLDHSALVLTTVPGVNPMPETVSVAAGSGVAWSTSASVSWLTASPAIGDGNGVISIVIDAAALPAGGHEGKVWVQSAAGGREINVQLTVAPLNVIQMVADHTRPVAYALHSSASGSSLLAVDPVSGTPMRSRTLPTGTDAFDLDTAGAFLYALAPRNGLVTQVDAATMTVSAAKMVAPPSGAANGVIIQAHNAETLCVRDENAALHLYDFSAGVERAVYDQKGEGIARIALSPDGRILWAWSAGLNTGKFHGLKLAVSSTKITELQSVGLLEQLQGPVPAQDGKTVFFGARRLSSNNLRGSSLVFEQAVLSGTRTGRHAAGASHVLDGLTGNVLVGLPGNPALVATFAADDSRLLRYEPGAAVINSLNGAEVQVFDDQPALFANKLTDDQTEPVDFGSVANLTALRRVFTVTNSGWTTLTNLVLTVDGPDAAAVSLQQPLLTKLAAGDSTTFAVTLQPQNAGILNATLHLASSDADDASFDIPITATVTVAAEPPVVVQAPVSQVVALGQAATFTVGVTGTGPLAYQWLLNNKAIAKATGRTYRIASAQSGHGGTYSVRVTNATGTAISEAAVLGVFALVTAEHVVNQTRNFTLTSKVWGDGLTFQWRQEGVVLPEDFGGAAGARNSNLVFTAATASSAGVYTLIASAGADSEVIATHSVQVREVPILQPQDLGTWAVGMSVAALLDATNLPTRFSAAGLPPGVTLKATTGQLLGQPTTPGSYTIRFTAYNPAGAGPEWSVPVTVLALPEPFQGAFEGVMERHTSWFNLGGRVSLNVTPSSDFTGTLIVEGRRHALAGALEWQPGNARAYARATVTDRHLSHLPLTFTFTIQSDTGECSGLLLGEYIHRPFAATRCSWSTTRATAYAGRYNVIMEPPAGVAGIRAFYPQGNGYGQVRIGETGIVIWSGRLADGTTTTLSTRLGNDGRVPLYLADPRRKTSALGWLNLSSEPPSGSVNWARLSVQGAMFYAAGIPAHNQLLRVERYTRPARGTLLLNLPDIADNAVLTLNQGASVTTLSQPFRISTGSVAAFETPNTHRFSITLNPATGLFTGSFRYDLSPGTMSGVFLPELRVGAGLFILPYGKNAATSITQGGQVVIDPKTP